MVWLEGVGKRIVIHDRDAKCAGSADRVIEAAGIRVIKTPLAAPKALLSDCFSVDTILLRRLYVL